MGLITVNGTPITLNGCILNVSLPDPEIYVTPNEIINVPYLGAICSVSVCGNKNNVVTAGSGDWWLLPATPITPSSDGTLTNIEICENITSSCRTGIVSYTPSLGGSTKYVTICQSTGDTTVSLCRYAWTGTCMINGGGRCVYERVCGPTSNLVTFSTSCSWIHASSSVSPCASPGRQHTICIDANTGGARSGTACYTPVCGAMMTVCFCQGEAPVYLNMCTINNYPKNFTALRAGVDGCICRSCNPSSGTYHICFSWLIYIANSSNPTTNYWSLYCNSSYVCGCDVTCLNGTYYGGFCKQFDYNDNICIYLCAERDFYGDTAWVCMSMNSLTSNQPSPCFCTGSCTSLAACTC